MQTNHLFQKFRWVIVSCAVVTLGASMPSCPGQQAMQQQIDTLTTANADLAKKVQTLSTQVSTLSGDMNQVKTILPQMTNVLTTQKTTLDQLSNDLKALQKHKGKKR